MQRETRNETAVPQFRTVDSALAPNAIAVEEGLIACVLMDRNVMGRVTDLVASGDFYASSNKSIFAVMEQIHEQGHHPDLLTVASGLQDLGQLGDVGGEVRLTSLMNSQLTSANADAYAKTIKQKSQRRAIAILASEATRLANDQSRPVDDSIAFLEVEAFKIAAQKGSVGLQMASSLFPAVQAKIEDRFTTPQLPGVATGFTDLDELTGGFHKSDLIVTAARPAMGKTSFVLNIARYMATPGNPGGDNPVLFFSLEMSKEQLAFRLTSSAAMVESNRLKAGKINGHEVGKSKKANEELAKLNLAIDDSSGLDVQTIRSRSLQAAALHGGIKCIFIDYLQIMGGADDNGPKGNRNLGLAYITRSLKDLAKELDCPIVLLSQLSRDCEKRADKRPMLADLRESGAIEQDANMAIFLYRAEYYDPDTPDRGCCEVILRKNRDGDTDTVMLLWDAQYTKFVNRVKINA